MRPALSIGILLMFFALALPQAAQARAKARAGKEEARVLFKQGNRLAERGMYLDALRKYKQARALYPSPKIDLNLGDTLKELGRHAEAATYFDRYLIQPPSEDSNKPEAERLKKVARELLDEMKAKVGSVSLSCPLDGAAVLLDGKVIGQTPLHQHLYMNPGTHQIRLEKRAYKSFSKQLRLKAGQHVQLNVLLAAARPGEPAPGCPDPQASMNVLGWSTLSAGLALTVATGALYGVGFSQGAVAHDRYSKAKTQPERDAHYQSVETAQATLIAGHVMLGVAVVAYGVSIYSFLSGSEPGPLDTAALGSLRAAGLTPHRGGALFSWGGDF